MANLDLFTQAAVAADRFAQESGSQAAHDLAAALEQIANAMQVDDVAGADYTRLMVYDVSAGRFKRVVRGPLDSGGTGYRALRIANI